MNAMTRVGAAARPVAVALLLSFALGGCFAYAPVRGDMPRPGARVKVDLATPQEFRTGDITANEVVQITGEVVSADTAALVLSAFSFTSRTRFEQIAAGESARVPRLNIASVQENRLSTLRTAALAGMAFLAGALFVSEVANPRGRGGSGPGGGNPQ